MKKQRKIIDGQVVEFELVDIWSRPGRWSRQRAYLFLTINFLVYASLNIFVYWMRHAELFDFSLQSYTRTYHETLIDFLFFPISIREAPVLIPIVAMVMATIIAIPILISQLYGFRYSVLFALCVLVIGHMPVLSFFLMVSSFIAGATKHKLPFKFGVALLSLLPIALYFYVATRGAIMLELKSIDPILLYAPWIFAFVAAALIAAAVLGFARLVKYRPGGILVAMIPFFAIPGVLFHHYMGRDQLEFNLIAHRFDPASPIYSSVDISGQVFEETLKEWRRYKVRDLQAIVDLAKIEFPYIAQQMVQEDRSKILDACHSFLRRYPQSRFVPNVLYLVGLAWDLRFDYSVLMRNWTVDYTTDLVSPQSYAVWKQLAEDYPESLHANPARYRLAILYVRMEQVDRARQMLGELLDSKHLSGDAVWRQSADMPTTIYELFTEPSRIDIPPIDREKLLGQAQKLLELIDHNADDPQFGAKPLAELMRLDPRHLKYRDHLLELAIKYSGGELHDNLLVRYALTDPDPLHRRALLERYSEQLIDRDAGAEVLYELGELLKALGLVNMDPESHRLARHYYDLLIDRYPHSIFAARARVKQARLEELSENLYE